MKLRDNEKWVSVRLDDRTILRSDCKYMSADQVAALENLEVVEIGRGRYKDAALEASRLRLIRERVGLSQSQLAKISGVSVRMIQKYEQADRDISKASGETLYRLALALDVTPADLVALPEGERDRILAARGR